MEFKPIETQEAFDAAIKERLERERAKFADYDELKSGAAAKEGELAKARARCARSVRLDAREQISGAWARDLVGWTCGLFRLAPPRTSRPRLIRAFERRARKEPPHFRNGSCRIPDLNRLSSIKA